MASYAIGDIQGCYHTLQDLLTALSYSPSRDTLWLVGDLINRGSGSLAVLRWCYAQQANLRVVLGNHDLHALVVAHQLTKPHRSDTLDALLSANDKDVLLHWLRYQPMAYQENNCLMVHAGVLPQWTATQTMAYAHEVEIALRADDYVQFLANMYGNVPNTWHDNLTGFDRLRVITNTLTRLRVCTTAGEMEFAFKGELQDVPIGYVPWFDVENRATLETTILFGHWSALGLQHRNNVYSLDTGCLWGKHLTAMDVESKAIIQVPFNPLDSNR